MMTRLDLKCPRQLNWVSDGLFGGELDKHLTLVVLVVIGWSQANAGEKEN